MIKTTLITKIQAQIKEEMNSPMNKHFDGTPEFNLGVVVEAIVEVKHLLVCDKIRLKGRRAIIKMLSKHNTEYSLEEHDNKMKAVNKELQQLKKIRDYDFLIKGKYEVSK